MNLKKKSVLSLTMVLVAVMGYLFLLQNVLAETDGSETPDSSIVVLPPPNYDGSMSLEQAIFNRKATRNFSSSPLSLSEISQLLWAGGGKTVDGVTGATRSYPSAGGLYPIEHYLIAENVQGISPGIYHYKWKNHSIKLIQQGHFIDSIKKATFSSAFRNSDVPACIVSTAVYSRTTEKYGERGGERYVPMDMGGSGGNIFLQATVLRLGTVIIGAFDGNALKKMPGFSAKETPLYVMPVGKRQK